MANNEINNLIEILSSFPGLGPRSARRLVLKLLQKKKLYLSPLIENLKNVADNIKNCHLCGNIDVISPCKICSSQEREKSVVCIVEEVSDLWALENNNIFKGIYHVLGGALNALKGVTPDKLNLNNFFERVQKENIQEVILATSITTSGQTTAHFILNNLRNKDIRITRLARGLPAGSELDYLDDATLSQALSDRTTILNNKTYE